MALGSRLQKVCLILLAARDLLSGRITVNLVKTQLEMVCII